MTYEKLEQTCILLYGLKWQSNLALDLNIDRRNIQNWRKQSVPRWMQDELPKLIEKRKKELASL